MSGSAAGAAAPAAAGPQLVERRGDRRRIVALEQRRQREQRAVRLARLEGPDDRGAAGGGGRRGGVERAGQPERAARGGQPLHVRLGPGWDQQHHLARGRELPQTLGRRAGRRRSRPVPRARRRSPRGPRDRGARSPRRSPRARSGRPSRSRARSGRGAPPGPTARRPVVPTPRPTVRTGPEASPSSAAPPSVRARRAYRSAIAAARSGEEESTMRCASLSRSCIRGDTASSLSQLSGHASRTAASASAWSAERRCSAWAVSGVVMRTSTAASRSRRVAREVPWATCARSPESRATLCTTRPHSSSWPAGASSRPARPSPRRLSIPASAGVAATGDGGTSRTRLCPRAAVGAASCTSASSARQPRRASDAAMGDVR